MNSCKRKIQKNNTLSDNTARKSPCNGHNVQNIINYYYYTWVYTITYTKEHRSPTAENFIE